MPTCEFDTHYLATPDFNIRFMHITSGIAIPVHALGFYCILYKTPNQMSSVKWLLFNLHIWSVVLDTVIAFLAIPYGIFPVMAGYGLGPVDSPGLFIYLIVTVINTETLSIFAIFENQYNTLFAEPDCWWKKVRKPVIAVMFIMNPLYFIPPQFMIPDQEMARAIVLKTLPCLPVLPPHRDLFVLSLDMVFPAISVILCGGVATTQVTIFYLLNVHHLLYSKRNARLSQRTIALQRKLAVALMFQSTASGVWFAAPVFVVIGIVKFSYHSQVLNNMIFVFVACHGICSAIIMIVAHRPYREFVVSPIRRLMQKVPVVLVGSNSS